MKLSQLIRELEEEREALGFDPEVCIDCIKGELPIVGVASRGDFVPEDSSTKITVFILGEDE